MSRAQKPISKAEAIVKITFVNIMWGLSFIASKYAMQQGFGEFTLAFARYVLVCLIMVPVLYIKTGKRFPLPARADMPRVFISGIAGISLYFVFEYMGVKHTSAANASLVLAAIPVFSILWAAIRGHRYSHLCWLGVLCSMLGVFFVVYFGASEAEGGVNASVLLGNGLLLLACICWVVYVELSNKLVRKYEHLQLTVWQGVAGMIALIPLALVELLQGRWVPVPLSGWLSVLFLAVICSALCFFLYAQSISVLSPVQTSIFINLNPIVAVIAGALLLAEEINLLQLIGGALIVASILLVNIGMNRKAA